MSNTNGTPQPTNLSDLGEFGLIEHLTGNNRSRHDSTIFACGDDAAVIGGGDEVTLWSTDTLVEGVHFDLLYTPLKHLGYKAVVTSISDIYAMNGTPKQFTVSIAVSNRMSVEALEELYQGIYLACDVYDLDLVGGDTTSSLSGTMLNVGVIGTVQKDKVAYRSGAKENDIILVTGDLGAAFLGLQLLEREKQVFKEDAGIQPDFSGYDYLLERQLKPEVKTEAIADLDSYGIVPNAMIDISDGLSSELIHIGRQSKCGFTIYEEKIPIDPTSIGCAEEFSLDPIVCALNGGEDYELLLTVSQEDYLKMKDNQAFIPIGHITPEEGSYKIVNAAGQENKVTAQGWDGVSNG